MGFEMPKIPSGSGRHAVTLVVVTANDLESSSEFYAKLFGWKVQPMSAELAGAVAPAGPAIALRCGMPAGSPAIIPYVGTRDVEATLVRVAAAGGSVDRAPWTIPGVGKLARFKDPSGTIYGLTDAMSPTGDPLIPMPFGSNPRPPAGAICSLEMYAADETGAARFFGDVFGWGTAPTMPQFLGFDPGAGIGGVFQSHTPATPAMAYIYVADVAAKIAEIEAAGGRRMGDPMPVPGLGMFGYFTDPSGTAMGLIGP
jgi:predicted enzyme related to lactoylglutathione lyase